MIKNAHVLSILGGYIQTGPGIVLSHAAFVEMMLIFYSHQICDTNRRTHDDDRELGRCLRNAQVTYGYSADSLGRPRFIMTRLLDQVYGNSTLARIFAKESAYHVGKGYDCCSNDLISLHYVPAADMFRFQKKIKLNRDRQKSPQLFLS